MMLAHSSLGASAQHKRMEEKKRGNWTKAEMEGNWSEVDTWRVAAAGDMKEEDISVLHWKDRSNVCAKMCGGVDVRG